MSVIALWLGNSSAFTYWEIAEGRDLKSLKA